MNELAQASSFLSELLNNTLDISKLDEGKIDFNNSYESIRNVIDVVLSICKVNATKKGIRLDAVYCNELPELMEFDKARLTQIIMNLVGNAIKFTQEKGKVMIKVSWKNLNDGISPRLRLPSNDNISAPTETVPDENSPMNPELSAFEDFIEKKIPGKIKKHSFVTRMQLRTCIDPIPYSATLNHEALKEGKEENNGSMSSPPECDRTAQNNESRKPQKRLSTFSTLARMVKSVSTLSDQPRMLHLGSTKRISLINVGKNFRMSQRQLWSRVSSLPKTPQSSGNKNRGPPPSLHSPPAIIQGVLTIDVIDTGCGMNEAEREKLFQPFSQTSKKVYGKFGGTGLGLWLCYKLINAMKGTITCNSEVNKGTTFSISMSMKSKAGTVDSSAAAPNGFKGFMVLCYLKNAEEVQRILVKQGCEVLIFENFKGLIEKLKENKSAKLRRQVVITGIKGAKLLQSNAPFVIKLSQIIVITSISPLITSTTII